MDEDRILAAIAEARRESRSAYETLGTRFDALSTRFDAIEPRFDAIGTRFDTLEARFDASGARFDTLEARFDASGTRFDTLDARFDKVETGLDRLRVDMMSKFERVEDKLTSMAEDITVNMMAVNNETSKRNADRAEVTTLVEMVTLMHRQMRRIQTELDELRDQRKAS